MSLVDRLGRKTPVTDLSSGTDIRQYYKGITMKKRRAVAIILPVSMILLFSCSEDTGVVCPDNDGLIHNVNVSGTVFAYYCSPYNGYNGSTRYSVATGLKATIKFLRLGDFSYIFQTDDSSRYDILVDTGTYDIILETGHVIPDTIFGVSIDGDTAIDFEFYYMFLNPDSISLEYYYRPAQDSLGDSIEQHYLRWLNGLLDNVIDLDNSTRSTHYSSLLGSYSVVYRAGFNSNCYAWQIMLAANSVLAAYESEFPEDLDVHVDDVWCLFDEN